MTTGSPDKNKPSMLNILATLVEQSLSPPPRQIRHVVETDPFGPYASKIVYPAQGGALLAIDGSYHGAQGLILAAGPMMELLRALTVIEPVAEHWRIRARDNTLVERYLFVRSQPSSRTGIEVESRRSKPYSVIWCAVDELYIGQVRRQDRR